eukprot:scaffold2177_cov272-Pinguiococcus_pyrenoidosus.AAC.18
MILVPFGYRVHPAKHVFPGVGAVRDALASSHRRRAVGAPERVLAVAEVQSLRLQHAEMSNRNFVGQRHEGIPWRRDARRVVDECHESLQHLSVVRKRVESGSLAPLLLLFLRQDLRLNSALQPRVSIEASRISPGEAHREAGGDVEYAQRGIAEERVGLVAGDETFHQTDAAVDGISEGARLRRTMSAIEPEVPAATTRRSRAQLDGAKAEIVQRLVAGTLPEAVHRRQHCHLCGTVAVAAADGVRDMAPLVVPAAVGGSLDGQLDYRRPRRLVESSDAGVVDVRQRVVEGVSEARRSQERLVRIQRQDTLGQPARTGATSQLLVLGVEAALVMLRHDAHVVIVKIHHVAPLHERPTIHGIIGESPERRGARARGAKEAGLAHVPSGLASTCAIRAHVGRRAEPGVLPRRRLEVRIRRGAEPAVVPLPARMRQAERHRGLLVADVPFRTRIRLAGQSIVADDVGLACARVPLLRASTQAALHAREVQRRHGVEDVVARCVSQWQRRIVEMEPWGAVEGRVEDARLRQVDGQVSFSEEAFVLAAAVALVRRAGLDVILWAVAIALWRLKVLEAVLGRWPKLRPSTQDVDKRRHQLSEEEDLVVRVHLVLGIARIHAEALEQGEGRRRVELGEAEGLDDDAVEVHHRLEGRR